MGYTRSEFAALRISDFEMIESAEQIKRRCRKVTTNEVEIFETKHQTKTGAVLDIGVRAKAIDMGGRLLVQGIWRSITERKRAEEELNNLNERLEQRVAERTEAIRCSTTSPR